MDVDEVTRRMKAKRLRELCRTPEGSRDRRCLTGVHKLESSRLSRLLDGPATAERLDGAARGASSASVDTPLHSCMRSEGAGEPSSSSSVVPGSTMGSWSTSRISVSEGTLSRS